VFERPRTGERAVLVRLGLGAPVDPEDLQEFTQLAVSAGALPVATVTGRRERPDPRYFLGSGKAAELERIAKDSAADIILVDHALSPSQERNLEKLIDSLLPRSGGRERQRKVKAGLIILRIGLDLPLQALEVADVAGLFGEIESSPRAGDGRIIFLARGRQR